MSAKKKTPPRYLKEAEGRIAKCRAEGGKRLDLQSLALTELPESVRGLTKLEKLDIRHNAILELPGWITELTALRELHWYDNDTVRLPAGLARLTHLECLNIGNDAGITGLEGIPRLPALQLLVLEEMNLKTVPPCLRGLSQLKDLSLRGNSLTELPDWAGEWTGLEELYLADNRLSTLPESLASLTRLRSLYLQRNAFTTLPPVLHRLPALKELWLEGNEKLSIPKEILATKDAQKILAYDRKLKEEGGERALNEAKMILVGRGAVGKTTLVHQLVHGAFAQFDKTKGIEVRDWRVKDGKEEITTHVWDFGGQEIMHGTHQFFLTERALYLLVLAGREDREDDDALYWLKMIAAFGSDSPVLVVLNKMKEHWYEVDQKALREKYPNIVGFYETDCKEDVGIPELRQAVEAQIRGMESVKKQFPAAWFRIKDELPTRARNFITFDQFREVCAELGEKDKQGQEDLAHFLHLLGIALNYRDDPRLQETSVLNPKWVTEGIYMLLNDEAIGRARGVLRRRDLARVLPAEAYPAEKHDFLLHLMKKFELCFPLDEQEQEWLIPELLGKQQLQSTEGYGVAECLCFDYVYPVLLPEGLLPRFMVRAYPLIMDAIRWRTGAVLQWGGAEALVRADRDERRISIRVKGPETRRLELLTLIRGHFDVIHLTFSKLEPREVILLPDGGGLAVDFAELEELQTHGIAETVRMGMKALVRINVRNLLSRYEMEGVVDSMKDRGTSRVRLDPPAVHSSTGKGGAA